MCRKPFSLILLGVLASLANVTYAAQGCGGCRGPSHVGSSQVIYQNPPVRSNFSQGPSYFGDSEIKSKTYAKPVVARPSHHKNRSQVKSLVRPKYAMHKHKSVVRHAQKPRVMAHLPRFRNIVAGSDINIILCNSAKPRVVVMSCDAQGRHLVGCCVRNGTLYLQDLTDPETGAVGPRPLQVLVDMNGLDSIQLNDRSSLYAQNYQANNLQIQSATAGSIIMGGTYNAGKIEQSGSGMINLDRVKGESMEIISRGPGLIRVAGGVNELRIRAFGNAHVDAKFLRTEDAWVETTGISEVTVTANNALDGYATGESTVYYYKTPQFMTPLTYEHANALQMAYWD